MKEINNNINWIQTRLNNLFLRSQSEILSQEEEEERERLSSILFILLNHRTALNYIR
jgi:hypothetical protein